MRHPEDAEQANLFAWAECSRQRWPDLDKLIAIPNGGKRSKIEAAIMKGCGVKAGVSDICLPVQRGGYGSLWIEMKAPGKIKDTTPKQKEWLALMNTSGNHATVCDSFTEAKRVIEWYLSL